AMAALDHRTELLPFAVSDEPGYSLTHWTQAHWSIRVWGSLGPFWADSFSLALSHARIGISRGFARQDGAGRWIADFLLSPAACLPTTCGARWRSGWTPPCAPGAPARHVRSPTWPAPRLDRPGRALYLALAMSAIVISSVGGRPA